jgi:hypothetical protein
VHHGRHTLVLSTPAAYIYISTTINLGSDFQITSFQERLYKYTGTAPTIGSVSGALDFWTIPTGDSGTVAVLPSTVLAAGLLMVHPSVPRDCVLPLQA